MRIGRGNRNVERAWLTGTSSKFHTTRPENEPGTQTLNYVKQNKICEICGFQGGDYKERRLLGCDAMWLLLEPMFRRNVLLHHQGGMNQRARSNVTSNYQLQLQRRIPPKRFQQGQNVVSEQKMAFFNIEILSFKLCEAEYHSTAHQLCSHSIVSQNFTESEGSLPHSQQLFTFPYPEPDQSTPHHPILTL
jgi:hypothetical protein